MIIVAKNGIIDTSNDCAVLIFKNDDELSSFISSVVLKDVRTTGVRVIVLKPENIELSSIQSSILSVIDSLDGAGGNEHDKILTSSINNIKSILEE